MRDGNGEEREYTPLEDALQMLSNALSPRRRTESISVREAYGRVLAADVRAPQDVPRRDASHFDGFAVTSAYTAAATRSAPVVLALTGGESRAGLARRATLQPGRAIKVATGAYLPPGADAVIPLEGATVRGDQVEVATPARPGDHVYPAGADVRKGDLILRAGRTLAGQDLALLASLHLERVSVHRRPTVGVLPTGTELTADIGDRRSGRTVESHSLLLEGLIQGAGGTPRILPIVPDERRAMLRALRAALKACDITFTLAGSSIGEPDLVESTIRDIPERSTLLVHGVRVNRGRVMGVAVVGEKPVVILPGPIQGALNAFIVFGYPLIRYYLGRGWEEPPAVPATLAEDWEATGRFKHFDQIVYLHLTKQTRRGKEEAKKEEKNDACLLAVPSSGETEKMSFLVSKNAYAFIPGGRGRLAKGELIQAHLLPGFSSLE